MAVSVSGGFNELSSSVAPAELSVLIRTPLMPPPQDLLPPAPPTTSGDSACLCAGGEASRRSFLAEAQCELLPLEQKKQLPVLFKVRFQPGLIMLILSFLAAGGGWEAGKGSCLATLIVSGLVTEMQERSALVCLMTKML